jgi:hypothetical protein
MKRAKKKSARARKSAKPKAVRVSREDAELGAVMDASAKSLGLKIEKSWRPQVLANLKVTMQHAARITEFALPEDIEPAPVFKA